MKPKAPSAPRVRRPPPGQLSFELSAREPFPDDAIRVDPAADLAAGLVVLPSRINRRWPIVLSYGVGVDSTAVIVLLRRSGIRPDLILFANTGSERPETLAYLAIINDYLARVGFPQVTVVQYTPVEAEYDNLYDNSTQFGMLPSLAYGGHKHGCSLKFKVGPMNGAVSRWAPAREAWAQGGKVVRIIGYDDSAADNERRGRFEDRGGALETDDYAYWYPLQDVHWDRARCIAEIEREGLPVPPKSACYFCPSTKPHELIELVLEHPDLAWRIIEMEQRAAPRLDVIDGLWGAGVVGVEDGVPRPGSMSEFIVQWMVDGRAYRRMPKVGDAGVVASEVARMPNVGRVFRLPMLGEPSAPELASLAERGRAAALRLRAHFEQVYGPVEAMVEAGRRRSELRKARSRERDKAQRYAEKHGLPWPPPKEKKPPVPRRKAGELPYPGWVPHVPRPLPR